MSARRRSAGIAALVSAALLSTIAACVPATVGYLSVPLEVTDGSGARERVELRVSLAELERRMQGYEQDALSFYHRGRAPIPHRLVDDDGDGSLDTAVVVLERVETEGDRLIAVCDGKKANGEVPEPRARGGVRLHFDAAWR